MSFIVQQWSSRLSWAFDGTGYFGSATFFDVFDNLERVCALEQDAYGWFHRRVRIGTCKGPTSAREPPRVRLRWWNRSLGLRSLRVDKRVVCEDDDGGLWAYRSLRGLDVEHRCVFQLVPLSRRSDDGRSKSARGSVGARVSRAAEERGAVALTYANLIRVDAVALWWRWVRAHLANAALLLDLDDRACNGLRAVGAAARGLECVARHDVYAYFSRDSAVRDVTSSVAANDFNASSSYFEFMKVKIMCMLMVCELGHDVLLMDSDVLVLRSFWDVFEARANTSVFVSSDVRTSGHVCEYWTEEHDFSRDWVCAGLMYARSRGGAPFLRRVVSIIDEYALLDQDAVQVALTGHTQVVVPRGHESAPMRRVRRNTDGWGVPTNVRVDLPPRLRDDALAWAVLDVAEFQNGPLMAESFEVLRSRVRPRALEAVRTVHGNCGIKEWLRSRDASKSFLLRSATT